MREVKYKSENNGPLVTRVSPLSMLSMPPNDAPATGKATFDDKPIRVLAEVSPHILLI